MDIYLFNTLNYKKEKFIPIKSGKVKFYACGPTVYTLSHIGNFRTYIFEDMLCKVLRMIGFKVMHVMNITDVGHLQSNDDHGEDKIILAAREEGKNPWYIAKNYERHFFNDFERLNLIKPNVICHATEHIQEMQKYIIGLLEKELAYEVDGNIYFNVSKFKNYNMLFKRKFNILKKRIRIEIDPRKQDQLDFVLWFSKSKFSNPIMKWNSPWGEGVPGWHIECTSMASKYLGDRIDIHAGGVDHIFIHHTNEIAQAEGYFGHKWVNYWLHGEFLILNKNKMSKSKRNFLSLNSLIDHGFNALHYKYLCINSHYRSQLIFSFEALYSAKNAFETLKNRVINFYTYPDDIFNSVKNEYYVNKFMHAMCDDLNSPLALSVVWQMIKDNSLGRTQRLNLMKEFDLVLGLNVNSFVQQMLPKEFVILIKKREQARKNNDWLLADAIRKKLAKKKILIKDRKLSSDWYFAYKD